MRSPTETTGDWEEYAKYLIGELERVRIQRNERTTLLQEHDQYHSCKGYPTRTHMDSLSVDPDHGCDCLSCRTGRCLAGESVT